jgi:hypothetical protein
MEGGYAGVWNSFAVSAVIIRMWTTGTSPPRLQRLRDGALTPGCSASFTTSGARPAEAQPAGPQ